MQGKTENLNVPAGVVDMILDTDTYNEIDDQFALAYMLLSPERIRPVGICAAPFLNAKSQSPADGMEKSYREIMKVLELMDREDAKAMVYRGSEQYLPDEIKDRRYYEYGDNKTEQAAKRYWDEIKK